MRRLFPGMVSLTARGHRFLTSQKIQPYNLFWLVRKFNPTTSCRVGFSNKASTSPGYGTQSLYWLDSIKWYQCTERSVQTGNIKSGCLFLVTQSCLYWVPQCTQSSLSCWGLSRLISSVIQWPFGIQCLPDGSTETNLIQTRFSLMIRLWSIPLILV